METLFASEVSESSCWRLETTVMDMAETERISRERLAEQQAQQRKRSEDEESKRTRGRGGEEHKAHHAFEAHSSGEKAHTGLHEP